jgi:hypothetical protein
LPAGQCLSFAAAYNAASSGDVVGVASGSYSRQDFAGWAGGAGRGTKAVTFNCDAGATIRQLHAGSPNLTFDGCNVDAGRAKLGGSDGAVVELGNADNVTFRNGSIGNVIDQKGSLVDGTGMVFENVRFHDVVIQTSGVHSECRFAEVPEGMVIRNSSFSNCAVMDILFVWPDWWSPQPPAYGHVTLDGNSFGPPVPPNGSVYVGGTGPGGDTTARAWQVTNNSFGSSGVWGDMDGSLLCGNTGSVDAAWKTPCTT